MSEQSYNSLIDIGLDENKGNVVVSKKMIPFLNRSYPRFVATGTDSCGSVWVLGADNSDHFYTTSYKLNINGLSNISVDSYYQFNNYVIPYNTFSLDGNYISNSISYSRNNIYHSIVNLYPFNKKRGEIEGFYPKYSYDKYIFTIAGYSNHESRSQVVDYISPNNQNIGISIRKYDISLGSVWENNYDRYNHYIINLTNIQIPNTPLDSDTTHIYYGNPFQAPNGKIYSWYRIFDNKPLDGSQKFYLSVYDNPDIIGTNLGYNFTGITLPGTAMPVFPNQGLVNYYGKPQPRPRLTLPSQQVCAQTPFVLSVDVSSLPGVPSGKQIWRLNDAEISYNPTDSYIINEPGVYNLSFQHEECIEHTTITVTSPITANVPPKDTICEGSVLLLTTLGSVFVSNAQNEPVHNPVSVAGFLTYTFAGCNSVSGSFELLQIAKPKLQIPNSVLGCVGSMATINPIFSSSLGQNLLWSNGSTLATITVTNAGLYVLTISNNCFTEQDSTEVAFYDKPKITQPTIDTTVCEGQQINIEANYPLHLNNINISISTFLGIRKDGNYTITSTNLCFTTTSFLSLKTDAIPRFSLPGDTVICDETSFNATVLANKQAGTTLVWYDGTNENTKTINQAGEYEIEVKNTCGVFKKAFSITFAKSTLGFTGTNVFTPNGDEKNDTWQPITENAEQYKLQIYNRYGTLVFETETWNQDWNASNSPDGVYFYNFSYLDCNKQVKNVKGTVSVLR